MIPLFRPTLHQVLVYDWVDATATSLAALLRAAVAHVAAGLDKEAAQDLAGQLARLPSFTSTTALQPLLRSPALLPVAGQPPLCCALFAYQNGSNLLVQFIWHWDGAGSDQTAAALLRERRFVALDTGVRLLGEGLLLTAIYDQPATDQSLVIDNVGQSLFALANCNGIALAEPERVRLADATLYVPAWYLPTAAAWPAALVFASQQAEATPEASELATVTWPLLVQYRARIGAVYADYIASTAPRLRERVGQMNGVLQQLLGQQTNGTGDPPKLLGERNPDQLQDALQQLSTAQYQLSMSLEEADAVDLALTRDLRNLEQMLDRVRPIYAGQAGAQLLDGERSSVLRDAVTANSRLFTEQLQADVLAARHEAERATRAGETLRTQTDILEARYGRNLALIVGILGVLFAVGQIIDQELARIVYTSTPLGRWWDLWIKLPIPPTGGDARLLAFRLGLIALVALPLAALIWWWVAKRRHR